MMRKKCAMLLFFLVASLHLDVFGAPSEIQLEIEKSRDLGRKNMMFASIASVCEDPEANLYVLDRMEHKVLKFAPEGELIRTFGQKGQGPGDFQNPHFLTFTPKGELVVADELYNLTFLTEDGRFVDRIHLDGRLAVSFIGDDRFYGWIWDQDHRTQVMVNSANDILKKFFRVPVSAFSASAPDETGRQVMFNYSREEFAPSLQFAHHGEFSAIGIGDEYDILILDGKGENKSRIRREIQPASFSSREKKYLEMDIEELGKERGWPRGVVRNLVKKIPDKKIFFTRVFLTDERVFVCRIKDDITQESSPFPVDIFSLQGEFLGSGYMPYLPLHITQNHVYFVRTDEEDNLYLEKATYKIVKK